MLLAISAGSVPVAVERLIPNDVHIRTSISERTLLYHYAPPQASSASGDGAAGSGDAVDGGTATQAITPVPGRDRTPVLLFSGSWGWRPMMQDTASYLAADGRHVLGIDTPAYYKRLVTPEEAESDLNALTATLNERAGRRAEQPVLIAGFDMGAANLPYLLNRAGTGKVVGLLLIAPQSVSTAVFRVAVLLDMPLPEKEKIDVAAEIDRLAPLPLVMMQGALDRKVSSQELMRHVKGPKLMTRIPGASHNFRERREIFYRQTRDALAWLERQTARTPRAQPRPARAAPAPPAQPPDAAPAGDPPSGG